MMEDGPVPMRIAFHVSSSKGLDVFPMTMLGRNRLMGSSLSPFCFVVEECVRIESIITMWNSEVYLLAIYISLTIFNLRLSSASEDCAVTRICRIRQNNSQMQDYCNII